MAKKKKDEDNTADDSNSSNGRVFPKKLLKKLDSEFIDAVNGYSVEEIKAKIVQNDRGRAETLHQLETDPEVAQIKDSLKLATEDYKEQIGRFDASVRYLCFVLEERGISNT